MRLIPVLLFAVPALAIPRGGIHRKSLTPQEPIPNILSPKLNLPINPHQLHPNKPNHPPLPFHLCQRFPRNHPLRLDLPTIRNINPLPNLRTRSQAARALKGLCHIHTRHSRPIQSRHNLHRRQRLHLLHSNNHLPKHPRSFSLSSYHSFWRSQHTGP
jgi:hypothetical protein